MSLILRSLLWLALVSSGMRLEASAQAPDSTPDLDGEWPWPAAVFVLEATAFGTAALTRSATGARVIGSIQGMSGLAVLSVAGFSDRETGYPEFAVPYGVGLVGLAYYNFRHADSPRRKQRFWINAIGLNVAVLAGILSSEIFAARKQGSSGMRPGPTGFVVSIPF